jgi:hypothetical protein
VRGQQSVDRFHHHTRRTPHQYQEDRTSTFTISIRLRIASPIFVVRWWEIRNSPSGFILTIAGSPTSKQGTESAVLHSVSTAISLVPVPRFKMDGGIIIIGFNALVTTIRLCSQDQGQQ